LKAKIIFKKGDDVLGSAIRGIAAQIAGHHTAKRNENMQMRWSCFDFDFYNEEQARRFEKAVGTYVAPQFQNDFKVEISN
jgi:hypothetical protein